MIGTTVLSVGAVLAGFVVTAVLVVGVETFSSVVHPFPPDADPTDLLKRYPRAATGKFNGASSEITELDALIAYLQMLGTLVRISDIPPERLHQ